LWSWNFYVTPGGATIARLRSYYSFNAVGITIGMFISGQLFVVFFLAILLY
jgi:hypothetical protein